MAAPISYVTGIQCHFGGLRRPLPAATATALTFSRTMRKQFRIVGAINPQSDEHSANTNNTFSALTSQEDLNYLWKLGAGSIAGAAIIKYGSILFPEITKPNIAQALLMISTPVIIAVLVLIKNSIDSDRNE